jgi:hypothetical protein
VVARTYKLIPEKKALSNKFSLILVTFVTGKKAKKANGQKAVHYSMQ